MMKGRLLVDTNVERFVDDAVTEMGFKCESTDLLTHYRTARWSLSQDTGEIAFESDKGVRALALAQIIGSYNRKEKSWVWAWSNATISPELRHDSALVRSFGETHSVSSLIKRKIACNPEDCWDFTAIACKLGSAQAAYEGLQGNLKIFITFKDLRIKPVNAHEECS